MAGSSPAMTTLSCTMVIAYLEHTHQEFPRTALHGKRDPRTEAVALDPLVATVCYIIRVMIDKFALMG